MSQDEKTVITQSTQDTLPYGDTRQNREPKIRLSRSPHPYFHRGDVLEKVDQTSSSTPARRRSEVAIQQDKFTHVSSRKRSVTPEESGPEGDDAGFIHVKALPAPVFRPRKGLRNTFDPSVSTCDTPLVTPSGSPRPHEKIQNGYFQDLSPPYQRSDEPRAIEKNTRRRSEILRRSCEIFSLAIIALVALKGGWAFSDDLSALRVSCVLVPLMIYALVFAIYVFTILLGLQSSKIGFNPSNFRIPTTFDPAPLIYPTILPILIASSLSTSSAATSFDSLFTNAILSLSALPDQVIPNFGSIEAFQSAHWFLTVIPVFVHSYLGSASTAPGSAYPEMLCILFPLHKTLISPLHYLTTSSLLSSELQLLSIALINVLILSKSPQLLVMRSIIWLGGFSMFVLCYKPLQWNVILERIPDVQMVRASKASPLNSRVSAESLFGRNDSLLNGRPSQNEKASAVHRRRQTIEGIVPSSVISPLSASESSHQQTQHRRVPSSSIEGYMRLPPWKRELKKWGYAIYTYLVTAGLIILPIRQSISSIALSDQNPFVWALGYLFSGLPGIHRLFEAFDIPLPLYSLNPGDSTSNGFVDHFRLSIIGAANTRLLLFGYWAIVLALGILTVLRLSASVEVDTRRKVFHGMMVLMLLPTAPIDSAFLSLGLVLVLAVFLLLDLFRAAQLRPVSRPLARFLTPYIDGRDLRGPVVVSHIFLLIGCAIPLWLSLAGIERTTLAASPVASAPEWRDWEVATRDTSMVAGVICVGVGDAAASLVGRRVGRHKWPWRGGKSLEGSAAFAVAVSTALLAAKAYLQCAGWPLTPFGMHSSGNRPKEVWWEAILKAAMAACGASFTEAVLTGCNDNVVVPIVLWLLVRGCEGISLRSGS